MKNNFTPQKDGKIYVKFRRGRENSAIGQYGRKICLVVETLPENDPVKIGEIWLCRIVEVFPNCIDVCPIKIFPQKTAIIEPQKTEVKKRKRIRIENFTIEKV